MEKRENEDMEIDFTSLPTEKGWLLDTVYYYQGFWFEKPHLEGILHALQTFEPQPNDVILATFPKCGTTWFAALLFTIINRSRYDFSDHPLLDNSPQDCVRWMENPTHVSSLQTPVVKTHTPYSLLPNNIIKCSSSIVYVCRSPLDAFVSLWHFESKLRPKELPRLTLDEALDMYCKGISCYGSYWDNVLEYWKASKERPDHVLFLRYEDMKFEPVTLIKKLASFAGYPFSTQEEEDGVVEKIVEFCSFDSLATLKVNRDTTEKSHEWVGLRIPNLFYFREGKVGDHENYLTLEMVQRLKEITSMKFKDTGLDVFA